MSCDGGEHSAAFIQRGPAMLTRSGFAKHLFIAALTMAALVGAASQAHAQTQRLVLAYATGAVVAAAPCEDNPALLCQTSIVSGFATRIGALVGELHERVDLTTGAYTGFATFTTPNGEQIRTAYVGQVLQFYPDGSVDFVEQHQITSGTGRFTGAA